MFQHVRTFHVVLLVEHCAPFLVIRRLAKQLEVDSDGEFFIVNVPSLRCDAMVKKVLFQCPGNQVQDSLVVQINLGSLLQQEYDNFSFWVGLGIVQRSVAIAVSHVDYAGHLIVDPQVVR